MNIFTVIGNFFKNLFRKKTDTECVDCNERGVCQTTDKDRKFALIVGMEQSKWGNCSGADKDSNTMNTLVSQFVDSSHIVRLNDSTGTANAVRNALNEQIAKVPEDGLFIFTYSGHGGQTKYRTNAGNEVDNKDEFLCLYDGYILDDELWTIFNKCRGRVFVVFDCCHSSTMYRLNPDGENDKDDVAERESLERPFFERFKDARANVKMLCISGCDEGTVSWGDAVNGGCLTSSLKRAFDKCLSYVEWWNKARKDSCFKSVKQVPVCTKIGAFDMNAKIFN